MSVESKPAPFRRLVSLHTIMVMVSLAVLLLPLSSLYFLKIYESALIRQTEAELISQAAFISALYKSEIRDVLKQKRIPVSRYGVEIPDYETPEEYYQLIPATLDLAHEKIGARHPEALKVGYPADSIGLDAGGRIVPVLKDAQRNTLSAMKILDYRGIVVAGQNDAGLSLADTPEFSEALKGEHLSLLRYRNLPEGTSFSLSSMSRNANVNVYVSLPIILERRLIGMVWLNRTPVDIVKVLYGKKVDVILAVVIVLGLTLLLAMFTSYTVTRPIHALIEQTRQMARGEKGATASIKIPVTREVAILSESFAEMARTVEHRSDYIKNFAMHLSHEFKTPLTGIQGAVELLREHLEEMPPEKRDKFLRNISEDTERLKKLVDRLLELARADMLEPLHSQQTELVPLLRQLARRYRDRNLSLQIDSPLTPGVNIEAEVLETVLTNLLDNSLEHGAEEVRISVSVTNGQTEITVADDGDGISEANRKNLFTPFFTTRRESGGTGLGLVIVKSLLEAHGGDITCQQSDGNGAVFAIKLQGA